MLTELPDTTMHQQNDYAQYTFSEQWFILNIYNCNTKIIHCTCYSTVAEIKLHQFSKFSTPLRNSSQVVNLLQICPPCSSFVSNLSSRFLPLLQIWPPEWLPCFRFVLNVFTRLVTLICMNLSNQTRSLYSIWLSY